MSAPLLQHPKLIGSTLHYPEAGEVLTGTVVAVSEYRGDFLFLMVVEGAPGFQIWDSELVYQDRADAAEAAEDEDEQDADENEDEDEDL